MSACTGDERLPAAKEEESFKNLKCQSESSHFVQAGGVTCTTVANSNTKSMQKEGISDKNLHADKLAGPKQKIGNLLSCGKIMSTYLIWSTNSHCSKQCKPDKKCLCRWTEMVGDCGCSGRVLTVTSRRHCSVTKLW